jgi:hypothetical protein
MSLFVKIVCSRESDLRPYSLSPEMHVQPCCGPGRSPMAILFCDLNGRLDQAKNDFQSERWEQSVEGASHRIPDSLVRQGSRQWPVKTPNRD